MAALFENGLEPPTTCRDFIYIMVGKALVQAYFCTGNLSSGDITVWPANSRPQHGNPKGRKCLCGKRGCLETEISIPALLEKASQAGEGPFHSLEEFIEALEEKSNPFSQSSPDEYAQKWPSTSATVNIFDPAGVVRRRNCSLCQVSGGKAPLKPWHKSSTHSCGKASLSDSANPQETRWPKVPLSWCRNTFSPILTNTLLDLGG